MNGFIILLIAVVVFIAAYATYGAWLCKKWGIDPHKKTPAVEVNDGGDYVPASPAVLLGHHFSSIAGAGPITGPINAAFFGWVPVFLWILIGGIFFGGVQDFSALFASIRHGGKSVGEVVGTHVGKKSKLIFNIFVFLVLLLVVAAFGDIVAGTFASVPAATVTVEEAAFTVEGVLDQAAYDAAVLAAEETNAANLANARSAGSVATASCLFIPLAMMFGLMQRKNNNTVVNTIIGVALLCASIAVGIMFPMMNISKQTWMYLTWGYIFVASVAPVWILLQPRDYLNSFLLYAIIGLALVGITVAQPTMEVAAFNGFVVKGQPIFPVLFITIACGAISGFHSLIASGTTSKQLSNEKDAKLIGYGGMLIECVLAVITLIAVGCAMGQQMQANGATPAAIFSTGIASFAQQIGLPFEVCRTVIALAYSAFCLTSLDSATRLGRMIFQELFDGVAPKLQKVLCNKYFATVATCALSFVLARAGYANIWPLFGAANQLVAVPAFMACAVWFKHMGKSNKMFIYPMWFMLAATMTSLVMSLYNNITKLMAGTGAMGKEGLQCFIIVPVIILAVILVIDGVKELKKKDVKAEA